MFWLVDFKRKLELSKSAEEFIEKYLREDDYLCRSKMLNSLDDIEVAKVVIKKLFEKVRG